MTNVFISAPTGIGKTICTEFALLRLWSKSDAPCAVCIEPYQDVVDQRVSEWQEKFGNLQGREGNSRPNQRDKCRSPHIGKGARVFVHPVSASGGSLWNADHLRLSSGIFSPRWKQRKHVQNIGLLIADEVQLIGGGNRPTCEVVISDATTCLRKPRSRLVSLRVAFFGQATFWFSHLSLPS
ncbi:hypothetical protein BS47DRAFT_1400954 [Hydnum rufescens UP504]|uniref:DEAD/DEAH-box helicase domain-containing protein n=1 Tax=Hydnum rufescens UP504 TaxID=1448309 RepID=A0A9P6AGK9_9AGAM|nr:hypothetical protein BS47DRAFT_1400954 [Hydnum rufescens UP504]